MKTKILSSVIIAIIFTTTVFAQTVDKMAWETKAMKRIKTDTSQLKKAEDVIVFERLVLNPFLNNLGILGSEKEVKSNYSFEQYKKMLSDVKIIEKVFESLEKRFNLEQSGGIYDGFMHLFNVLEMRTNYSDFHNYKKRNGLEE